MWGAPMTESIGAAISRLGELTVEAGKYVVSKPDLVLRGAQLLLDVFRSRDPQEALRLAEAAMLKEGYRHGFTPTPERDPNKP